MVERLKGKKALITGASRGIGRAIAKKFAEEKAILGINYRSSENKANEVLNAVKRSSRGMLLKGDVSKRKHCKQIINDFVEEFGGLDILVNNAGIYKRKNLEKATIDDFDQTMGVNARGPFMMCKYSLKYLNESDSGRIINMSSQLAFSGSDHGTSYVVSKAALLGLTRALALELGPKGITVNGIAPGTIDTDIISSYSDEKRRKRAENIPVKRIGLPGDIADAALFLASEEGSYVNGEVIGVNGGSTIH
ncbi:MAG: 3-oxoacyl-ACP reductase FabG [Candidatus Thermoplasmatota archaeon]|nr:3-oxoacyl-ACP reductase FabG [Candidatus Thermoplasmatota archaeon]MBS3789491.1 3-oxoacyl-ACP reductase FabG [Candidatus Thermoplasmatota archaeon]